MGDELLLVQPRHLYAPEPTAGIEGHIYMPTSLLSVAARLLALGVQVRFVDENLHQASFVESAIGINLVGAPYVIRALEFLDRLAKAEGDDTQVLLGGTIVSGFSETQFHRLFGTRVWNGNVDVNLAGVLELAPDSIPPPTTVSLRPAYELIPDHDFRKYISAEQGFYLADGCRYSCTFCAATRSHLGRPTTEIYRAADALEVDLRYLLERAERLGVQKISLYLSNLDLFQTPAKAQEFARIALRLESQHPAVNIRMRALSNVDSFLATHKLQPTVIEDLVAAGLYRLGFGIDGAAPEVWRAVRKPHSKSMCVEAIRVARMQYGLEPESLLVFGHNSADTGETLQLAVDLTEAMWREYGSHPRPHVAKAVVPGNDGWRDSGETLLADLLVEPRLFQALDFTALASTLTHPDRGFRRLVNRYYLLACKSDGCVTQHVLPFERGMSPSEWQHTCAFNEGRYDV